ncbi:MAG: hypothetical protein AAFY60_14930, partial [Myxococcota bacterium]
KTEFELGAFGTPTEIVVSENDVEVQKKTFEVDENGLLQDETSAGLVVPIARHDPEGRTFVTYDFEGGATIVTEFDPLGYPRGYTLPVGQGTELTEFNDSGTLARLTDRRNEDTRFTYDEYDEPETVNNWRADITILRDTTRTRSVGGTRTVYKAPGAVTLDEEYAPDCLGRPTRTVRTGSGTEAASSESSLLYDSSGDLVMVTETQGGASSEEGDGKTEYTFVYDGFGRLYQESVDERLVRTILYDVDDNVVSIDIPDGGVTTLAPDSFNAPLQVTGPDGTVEITQQDAVGRVVREEVLSPEGASVLLRSYTYDDLDRPLSITDTVIDGDDQRPVLYEYAYSADRLTTTLNIRAGGETRTSSVTRELAGRVASSTDAEGTTTRLTYTGPDLTGIEVIRAGEDNRVTRQSLVPDQGGRTTSLTLTGASVDDPEAASRTITYRYDTRDNVLEETVSGGVSVVRTYDAFDRLRSESLGEQQTTYT